MLAERGQKTVIGSDGKMTKTSFGDADALMNNIKKNDWNDYHIIARGGHNCSQRSTVKVYGGGYWITIRKIAIYPACWRCSCIPVRP